MWSSGKNSTMRSFGAHHFSRAPGVGLEQRRPLEVRDEAAQPVRRIERIARLRQTPVAGEEAQARQREERRHALDAVRAQRISDAERPAPRDLVGRLLK